MHRVASVCVLLAVSGVSLASNPDQFVFDVYLDDDRIGSHAYEIIREEGETRVSSSAKFDVKFLFITAFKYRHTVSERWSNGCLQTIEAETSANGKKQKVGGQTESGNFIVNSNGEEERLGDCVMSFAYWNPEFLDQSQLLNPQTGEYLPVEVSKLDLESIDATRRKLGASAYQLTAKGLQVTVWYSADGDWVGLESVAKGGRVLRYEIA